MRYNYKKNQGVTIIAMVITILIILIISGAVITVSINGGLFSHTQRANDEYLIADYKDYLDVKLTQARIERKAEDIIYTLKNKILNDTKLIDSEIQDIDNKSFYLITKEGYEFQITSTNVEYIGLFQEPEFDDTIIMAGGVYTAESGCGGTYDTEGQKMPETVSDGDTYVLGDYTYMYNYYYDIFNQEWTFSEDQDGWGVYINDTLKTSYGNMLPSINTKPVNTLISTFASCTSLEVAPVLSKNAKVLEYTFIMCDSLTTAPIIPNSVERMYYTFYDCISLKTYTESKDADGDFSNYIIPNTVQEIEGSFGDCLLMEKPPAIPNNIENADYLFAYCSALTSSPELPNTLTSMVSIFSDCTSLTTAPTVPTYVQNMDYAFAGCTSLTGTITVNANPSSYTDCLKNTQITAVGGSTTLKTQLMNTK